ncbi:uncharacterized protein [Rutidosis leptorrhynchoides]|uniref:uncharacterized protein n=1 Tax=Rutidosis leptorrhynchoides TaxID=125765 RepID=UPI003A992832
MALRSSMANLKSMLTRTRGTANFTTATTLKLRPYTPTVDEFGHSGTSKKVPRKGDYVPVYVALGLITMSVSFGLFTVYHELKHAPNVHLKKKRRETLPEVYDPDKVLEEADGYLKKSFFRKIAHVQEFDNGVNSMNNTITKDVFARQPKAETLKEVGINPKEVQPPIKLP